VKKEKQKGEKASHIGRVKKDTARGVSKKRGGGQKKGEKVAVNESRAVRWEVRRANGEKGNKGDGKSLWLFLELGGGGNARKSSKEGRGKKSGKKLARKKKKCAGGAHKGAEKSEKQGK